MAAAPDAIVVASVVQIPPRSLARNTAAGAPAALEQRRAAALPLRLGPWQFWEAFTHVPLQIGVMIYVPSKF